MQNHTLTLPHPQPEDVVSPVRGSDKDAVFDAPRRFRPVFVDQYDMYKHVFSPLEERKVRMAPPPCVAHTTASPHLLHSISISLQEIPDKFMVAVLVDYIRSLNQFKIGVQHYIYEIVINLFVQHSRYYQLHQFLQYHVVHDSKHVVRVCVCFFSLARSPPPLS